MRFADEVGASSLHRLGEELIHPANIAFQEMYGTAHDRITVPGAIAIGKVLLQIPIAVYGFDKFPAVGLETGDSPLSGEKVEDVCGKVYLPFLKLGLAQQDAKPDPQQGATLPGRVIK